MVLVGWLAAGALAFGCGPQSGGTNNPDPNPNPDAPDPTGDAPVDPLIDAPTANGVAPGGACSCDADCADEGSNEGVCIFGVCMTKASGACASPGSASECPTGSRCWTLNGADVGPLCWPDCSAHSCAGECDGDGSCAPSATSNCDVTCGSECNCTDDNQCGAGNQCVMGDCVPEVVQPGDPGPGPGPACMGLPARDCTTGCGTLVSFSPRTNAAWDDYPINGETAANQYRSFLRKDLMMLVSYATSVTACKAAGWGGNGGALGLGDMSEANGAIPGTSIGSPGHPSGTHTNGYDIDLAYYQTGTADNRLRPVCPHISGGMDAYRCLATPDLLDVWRTALFLGTVFESPRTRVIGVDGQVGPLLVSALDTLCDNDWLSDTACANISLAYETTNMGQGWYNFHHHHAHISLNSTSLLPTSLACMDPQGCDLGEKRLPGRTPGVHRIR